VASGQAEVSIDRSPDDVWKLLREFGGSKRQALAAWYQGPTSVRKRGAIRETKIFIANVLALRQSSV